MNERAGGDTTVTKSITERELQQAVMTAARYLGWTCVSITDSRRSYSRGWPDVTFVRPPAMFCAELKTERGTVRPEQRAMHDLLRACGVPVYVWRPKDWMSGEIEAVLRGEAA